MKENQKRELPGRPTGGRFAASEHAAPDLELDDPPISAAELSGQRDDLHARLLRINDATGPIDRAHQRLSVRTAAAAIRELYPAAASFTLEPNADGERQLDLFQVLDAQGNVLADVTEDNSWVYETVGDDNGPELGELTLSLDTDGDSWAEGIAHGIDWRERSLATWRVEIDKAIEAEDEPPRDEADPTTRTLTPAEQALLVETARGVLYNLVDQLNVHWRNYTEEQQEEMRRQRDRLADVITWRN